MHGRVFHVVAIFASCAMLAGCAGGGTRATVPLGGAIIGSAGESGPAPFNPKSGVSVARSSATQLGAGAQADAVARLAAAQGRAPLASSMNPDKEEVGVEIAPGGYYSAIYALQSAYPASQIQIAYPAGSADTSAIYESLTAPNGGCLGNFATWINAGSGTQAVFSVYDYCAASPHVVFQMPIDAAFLAKYTQPNRDGVPMYASEILTYDLQPTPTSQWASIIFNVQTGLYEELARSTGVLTSRTMGFARWTTEYQPQACPSIPLMGADHVELYDNLRNRFEYVVPSMTDTTSHLETPQANYSCFNATASGTSYQFTSAQPNQHWTIAAITQQSSVATKTFTPPFGASSLARGEDVNIWYSGGPGAHFGSISNGSLLDYPGTGSSGGTIGPIAIGGNDSVWFPYYPVHGASATGLNRSGAGGALSAHPSTLQPFDVVRGPDANMWTVSGTSATIAVQKFAPGGGAPVSYPVAGAATGDTAQAITAGADGNLWFVINNFVTNTARLYKTTTAGTITLVNTASGTSFNDLTATAAGVWVSDVAGNRVIRFAADGSATPYALTTAGAQIGAIASAPNGDVWFVESSARRIGHLSAGSGTITDYPIDPGSSNTTGQDIAVDSSGNVWVATGDRILEYVFH